MKKETVFSSQLAGKKILFANIPADGHFNPLTGLAMYLQGLGADVRWYTSAGYSEKLKKLGIIHYPYKRATDVADNNFDKAFPERVTKKGISKLKFDIVHVFVLRSPEYYHDILDIHAKFPFDLMVADCAFGGIPFVKELMKKPVVSVGVLPLTETSKDAPPAGLGLAPANNVFGKIKQAILRTVTDRLIFKGPNKVMFQLFDEYKIPHNGESIFDMLIRKSDLLLQSGTPGFEYRRSDLGKNIRFIGPLLPYVSPAEKRMQWFDKRLNEFQQIVLVTQGTVEKHVEKLIVPTLEAFKNSETLVVCTTGGSKTQELRERYPYRNIIIEDFIPFGDIMPYVDAYITNGGYGGVMLGIKNRLPLVVAGLHEGKNEINARVGYFKLGINLGKERPTSREILKAVQEVISNSSYKSNAEKLADEFRRYEPGALCAGYIAGLLNVKKPVMVPVHEAGF